MIAKSHYIWDRRPDRRTKSHLQAFERCNAQSEMSGKNSSAVRMLNCKSLAFVSPFSTISTTSISLAVWKDSVMSSLNAYDRWSWLWPWTHQSLNVHESHNDRASNALLHLFLLLTKKTCWVCQRKRNEAFCKIWDRTRKKILTSTAPS